MRIPILFTGLNRALPALGLTRSSSYVEVGPGEVVVRMGWAFHAVVPRTSIRAAAHDHDAVWGWGVHGWGGRWLVNGSSSGLVRIDIDPPARARTAGVPVSLHTLRVSVEDPDGLIAAVS